MIDFDRLFTTMREVATEVEFAGKKHAADNVRHDLPGWIGTIEKQVGDLKAEVYNSRRKVAMRKELKQIAAAAILAMVHTGDPVE